MKQHKAYRIQIGLLTDGIDYNNHDSKVVVACDAVSAIKRIRLKKDEYIAQAEIVTRIDKP
jgi:hypothetical protein